MGDEYRRDERYTRLVFESLTSTLGSLPGDLMTKLALLMNDPDDVDSVQFSPIELQVIRCNVENDIDSFVSLVNNTRPLFTSTESKPHKLKRLVETAVGFSNKLQNLKHELDKVEKQIKGNEQEFTDQMNKMHSHLFLKARTYIPTANKELEKKAKILEDLSAGILQSQKEIISETEATKKEIYNYKNIIGYDQTLETYNKLQNVIAQMKKMDHNN